MIGRHPLSAKEALAHVLGYRPKLGGPRYLGNSV
jgi:hypothetical protein